MDDLSYRDENGNTIFTSQYYRNRGSCCKSGCLHCPYGYTLKTVGLEVSVIKNSNEAMARDFFHQYIKGRGVGHQLLSSAFPSENQNWVPDKYRLLSLKGYFCGLLQLEKGEYKKHYLLPEFCNQGIDDIYIRSLV